jgi:glycosyltransferase involved in cell wall biosynthesis
MNIGIDIRALTGGSLTGIGNYIASAINAVSKQDKANTYYLLSSGLKVNIDSAVDLDRSNIKHIHQYYPNKLLNSRFALGFGPNLINKIPVKLDLFWLPNINFFKFDKHTPTILTIHDLSFLHSREFYSLKRRYWHKLVNVDKLINKAAKIIAVSGNTKRDIVRFFTVPEEKIQVINPGVTTAKMDRDYAKLLTAKFKLPQKYFIYVGTLEPRKNISGVIKAFDRYHKDYPYTELVIVGSKGWIYRNILRDIKKRKYIRYLGYIPSPAKDALYHLSQGLIWPSFYEGFGFPPMEATYHNIPVIVSYKTSLPEIMKQQALYVDPYNVSDIYQALKSLTEDKVLADDFKTSAKDFKVPQWDKQATKLIKLFNSFKK